MTHVVLKSRAQFFSDFDAAVNQHIKEMDSWHAHMQEVERVKRVAAGLYSQGKDAESTAILQSVTPYPAPEPHPDVKAAVKLNPGGTHYADYILQDDLPTPEQILQVKKQNLMAHVCQLEQDALHKVIPLGKRRLFEIQHRTLKRREEQRKVDLHNEVTASIPKLSPYMPGLTVAQQKEADDKFAAIPGTVEGERSPEEAKLLALAAADEKHRLAIELHAANLLSEIEDLTAETIDAWKPTPFPQPE